MTVTTHPPNTSPHDAAGAAQPPGWLARLAGWSYDHRRRVLVLWIGLLVVASVTSGIAGNAYQDRFTGNAESQQAQDLLKAKFPAFAGDTADMVVRTDSPVTSPANEAKLTTLIDQLKGLPHVAAVRSPFDQGGQSQISSGGRIAYAEVQFDQQTVDLPKTAIRRVIDTAEAARASGFDVELGGQPIEFVLAPSPGSTEFVGVAAAIVILLVAFGSAIAMGLPIVTALFGIGIGYAVVAFVSHGLVVPDFGPALAAMIGLGVGIDYALFIVTRYRQALHDGAEPRSAVIARHRHRGAGGPVRGVHRGDLAPRHDAPRCVVRLRTRLGTIAAVLLVLAASLTLLPAMLGFAGRAIDRLRVPGSASQHEPGPSTALVPLEPRGPAAPDRVGVIGALAVLLACWRCRCSSMRLLFADAGNDPRTCTTRKAVRPAGRRFRPRHQRPAGRGRGPRRWRRSGRRRQARPPPAAVDAGCGRRRPAAAERQRRHGGDRGHSPIGAPGRGDRDARRATPRRGDTVGGRRQRRAGRSSAG